MTVIKKTINGVEMAIEEKFYWSLFSGLIVVSNEKGGSIVRLIPEHTEFRIEQTVQECVDVIDNRSEDFLNWLIDAGCTFKCIVDRQLPKQW